MARPRKQLIPIEKEAKEFLESKKGDQKTSLTVRETVAAIMLAGQLASGKRVNYPEELVEEAYRWADLFLKK